MKLTFIGADHEVTGSCALFEACGKKILIDCGMEQGVDVFVNEDLPVLPAEIDCVLLTHAHIDHAGRLPILYKEGFRGKIFATAATVDLCGLMLRDAAHIQESEAEWKSRKAVRAGHDPVEPLFTTMDANNTLRLLVACDYEKNIPLYDGISLRMVDAGHLLGSASLEISVTEKGISEKIVFSGDIGNVNQPLIKDPTYLTEADYVVMESTYGNRSHAPSPDYIKNLTEILQTTFDRGGSVIIPAFAVGRTQQMLYFLRKIKEAGLIKGHNGFPVYVDSPLANEATNVFKENLLDCSDAEAMELVRKGINPISLEGLRVSVSAEDSKAINMNREPKVILSASGMCDAGRIKHHLKHNLWRAECTVLIVGYQSAGTLGRAIVDGAEKVKIFDEIINVKAEIRTLEGLSGHADDKGLMRWAAAFREKPVRVFINHGDEDAAETFAARLKAELGYTVTVPYSGDAWDLSADQQVAEGDRARVQKKEQRAQAHPQTQSAFATLLAAVQQCKNLAPEKIIQLTEYIKNFCRKK